MPQKIFQGISLILSMGLTWVPVPALGVVPRIQSQDSVSVLLGIAQKPKKEKALCWEDIDRVIPTPGWVGGLPLSFVTVWEEDSLFTVARRTVQWRSHTAE